MADHGGLEIGNKVEVTGKGVRGVVAFVGITDFASGVWVGLVLDEPKGKNNGTVQGKSYFECAENHGMFVRPPQVMVVDGDGSAKDMPPPKRTSLGKNDSPSSSVSGSSTSLKNTPEEGKASGLKQPKSRLRIQTKFSTPSSLSKSPLKPMSQAQRRNQLTRYFSNIPFRRYLHGKNLSQSETDLSSASSPHIGLSSSRTDPVKIPGTGISGSSVDIHINPNTCPSAAAKKSEFYVSAVSVSVTSSSKAKVTVSVPSIKQSLKPPSKLLSYSGHGLGSASGGSVKSLTKSKIQGSGSQKSSSKAASSLSLFSPQQPKGLASTPISASEISIISSEPNSANSTGTNSSRLSLSVSKGRNFFKTPKTKSGHSNSNSDHGAGSTTRIGTGNVGFGSSKNISSKRESLSKVLTSTPASSRRLSSGNIYTSKMSTTFFSSKTKFGSSKNLKSHVFETPQKRQGLGQPEPKGQQGTSTELSVPNSAEMKPPLPLPLKTKHIQIPRQILSFSNTVLAGDQQGIKSSNLGQEQGQSVALNKPDPDAKASTVPAEIANAPVNPAATDFQNFKDTMDPLPKTSRSIPHPLPLHSSTVESIASRNNADSVSNTIPASAVPTSLTPTPTPFKLRMEQLGAQKAPTKGTPVKPPRASLLKLQSPRVQSLQAEIENELHPNVISNDHRHISPRRPRSPSLGKSPRSSPSHKKLIKVNDPARWEVLRAKYSFLPVPPNNNSSSPEQRRNSVASSEVSVTNKNSQVNKLDDFSGTGSGSPGQRRMTEGAVSLSLLNSSPRTPEPEPEPQSLAGNINTMNFHNIGRFLASNPALRSFSVDSVDSRFVASDVAVANNVDVVDASASSRAVVNSEISILTSTPSPFKGHFLKSFMQTRIKNPTIRHSNVQRSMSSSCTPLSYMKAHSNNPNSNSGLVGLPVAGIRDLPTPGRKSLQSTPSGSRTSLVSTGAKGDFSSKRSSFVETGFVEAIIPQYTPGTPSSVINTPASTPAVGGMTTEDRFSAVQNNEALRSEVRDLTEKVELLRSKRAADQEKLREMDRIRLQVETLTEFKAKVLESQQALQRDLKKAKQDAREAIEGREQHADEMSDLSEAVEMATLDKEMAEEKAETLQLELEQAQEKIAELETEMSAFKDESTGKVNPETGELTTKFVKQLQEDNARLREALVKLRDASAHEKHLHQKTTKDAEARKVEVAELQRTKERLEARVTDFEAQIADLQEQNDAALGAEEMVESLTEKNLNLEEKVGTLTEAVADLEALQDINEQLQESSKEMEIELRDDLQQAMVINQNILREREALLETVADRDSTIVKFREVVQQLRDDNIHLRRNLEEESSKSIPGLTEQMDFKKIFEGAKAQTTAIDLELRRLEAKEAALHVKYLSSFMPEGFMKRGGDNDALLVLLLVPRLVCKGNLLLTQVREKLIPANLADGVSFPSGEIMASSPDVERYAFSSQFCFLLYTLLCELHRWASALSTCSSDLFLKIGVLLPELAIQEKSVDFYLELLRKSQLDENIPLDHLEKCVVSFQSFYSIHLSEEHIEPSTLVSDLCLASAAASDCIIVDVNRLMSMLKRSEKESNVAILLQDVKAIGESLRKLAKRTRSYLPDSPKQPPVSNKLQSQLLNDCVTLAKVVKILQEACKQAVRHSGSLSGTEGIASGKVEEFLQAAMENCDSRAEGSGGIKEVVKEWLTTALMTMTDLAQVVNEAPVMPKEKPPTPLGLRSQAVKAELDQTRNLKIQLEDKEATIKELRKALRAKQEELSEASIRKELAEKKLSNVSKDNEMSVEKLTRKLEDVSSMLQRKEREFEATLEHFQSLIESLENERGELKDKLLSASKRTLLSGLLSSTDGSPMQSPSHVPASHNALTLSQVSVQQGPPSNMSTPAGFNIGTGTGPASSGLIDYTRFLQRQNWKMRSEKVAETLKKLPPLQTVQKNNESLKALDKEFWILKREWIGILGESVKLGYNTKLSKARKEYYLGLNELRKKDLMEKMAILKEKINTELAERNSEFVIKADFATFSANDKGSSLKEKDAVKVGALKFPGWEKSKDAPTRIVLSEAQIQEIHRILTPFD